MTTYSNWRNHPQWRNPKRPKSGPSFPTSCSLKVPRNQRDQAVAAELSRRFRAGTIYAYSYEGDLWTVWPTQADWDATERLTETGRVIRDQAAKAAGHGPETFDITSLTAPTPAKRPGKAAYVEMLRRIRDGVDWSVDELDQLLAVA